MSANVAASLTQPTASVIVAMLALSGSIIIWALGNFATKRRDAITRAAEIRKQFLERQIEEFYGPLLSLSSRIAAIRDIRDRLVDAFEKKGENLNGDTLVKLRRFVRTEFTMPTNRQIEQILTNRLHLLGEDNMPETFFLFLTSTSLLESAEF